MYSVAETIAVFCLLGSECRMADRGVLHAKPAFPHLARPSLVDSKKIAAAHNRGAWEAHGRLLLVWQMPPSLRMPMPVSTEG